MIVQFKRLSILQAGKLLAVIYGLWLIIMLSIALIMLIASNRPVMEMIVMIVLWPLCPLLGFVGGVIGAVMYNLAARMVGGIKVTIKGNDLAQ